MDTNCIFYQLIWFDRRSTIPQLLSAFKFFFHGNEIEEVPLFQFFYAKIFFPNKQVVSYSLKFIDSKKCIGENRDNGTFFS